MTRVKIIPELANDHTIPEAERTRGKELANNLSMATLTSAWQILLKGLTEIKMADNPLIALEMVLIRLAFLGEIPTLGTVLSDIKKNTITVEQSKNEETSTSSEAHTQQRQFTSTQQNQQRQSNSQSSTPVFNCDNIKTLKDISNLAKEAKERLLAFNIETYIRPISIEKGKIVCAFTPDSPRGFSAELTKFLTLKTGIRWEISIQQDAKTNTLKEDKAEKTGLIIEDLKRTEPLRSVLNIYPKAQIGRIKEPKKDEVEEENY